jgi:hypothetical protein
VALGEEIIEFSGIQDLYEWFWEEIPKPRFGPSDDADDPHD